MTVEPPDQWVSEEAESSASGGVSPREWIQFILGAARRHMGLGIACGAALMIVGIAVSLVIPSVYESSGKILVTQSAAVTAILSNPSRSLPNIDPMRGVTDMTMRKENLEAIIRDTKLLEQWDQSRTLLLRIKDWAVSKISGEIADNDKVQALVGVLESRLSVRPEDATSIRIRVSWGSPEMAQNIAKTAQKRFLDGRGNDETASITAAIDILEDELKRAAEAIEPEQQRVMEARKKALGMQVPAVVDGGAASGAAVPQVTYVRPTARPAGPSAGLSAKLNEIRQSEREVQEPWQRRLTELRLQLSDLKSTYGPAHPLVVQQEAKIKDASIEPTELVNLRQEERGLLRKSSSERATRTRATAGWFLARFAWGPAPQRGMRRQPARHSSSKKSRRWQRRGRSSWPPSTSIASSRIAWTRHASSEPRARPPSSIGTWWSPNPSSPENRSNPTA